MLALTSEDQSSQKNRGTAEEPPLWRMAGRSVTRRAQPQIPCNPWAMALETIVRCNANYKDFTSTYAPYKRCWRLLKQETHTGGCSSTISAR